MYGTIKIATKTTTKQNLCALENAHQDESYTTTPSIWVLLKSCTAHPQPNRTSSLILVT